MPTYNYLCTNCKNTFELWHNIKNVVTKCPKCLNQSLTQQLGTYSIHFKGTGFHTTDYDKKSSK